MSALRYSRPGVAGTTLVDLGPTTPRAMGHRFYLLSEVATNTVLRPQPVPIGRVIKRKPYTGPRCGHVLPLLGEPCYRRPHTGRDHRSEAAVKADMKRRRGEQ